MCDCVAEEELAMGKRGVLYDLSVYVLLSPSVSLLCSSLSLFLSLSCLRTQHTHTHTHLPFLHTQYYDEKMLLGLGRLAAEKIENDKGPSGANAQVSVRLPLCMLFFCVPIPLHVTLSSHNLFALNYWSSMNTFSL